MESALYAFDGAREVCGGAAGVEEGWHFERWALEVGRMYNWEWDECSGMGNRGLVAR